MKYTFVSEGVIEGVEYVTVLDEGGNPMQYNITRAEAEQEFVSDEIEAPAPPANTTTFARMKELHPGYDDETIKAWVAFCVCGHQNYQHGAAGDLDNCLVCRGCEHYRPAV